MSGLVKKTGIIVALMLSVSLVGCGTLTGIPSHGGGKRFAIEQRLVTTTIRGAIKQIDLTNLRGKVVYLQITSINDQGAGNIIGGRASLLFGLQGITESGPITNQQNKFKVFDLSSSSATNTSQSVRGTTVSENNTNSVNNTSSSNKTVTDSTSNGTNTSTSEGSTTNENETSSSGKVDTTTTTGSTVTTQAGTNSGSTDSDGSSTSENKVTGSDTQVNNGTTTNTGQSNQQGSSSSTSTSATAQSSTLQSGTTENRQALAPQAEESETQTKGSSYKANAGINYQGQGNYQNFNVPVSDVGILQSIVRTYFYLNDVRVTTDPNNPAIQAIVNINIDVFGSIRSRLDTIVYNKETVKVQTVLEVMAINYQDQTLMMVPQTGAYEAVYDEKYAFWIGPFNNQKKRITHHNINEPLLVDFDEVVQAKIQRDKARGSAPNNGNTDINNNVVSSRTTTPNQSQGVAQSSELAIVQQTISKWLKSWEQGNVADYLAHYSPSFTPEQGLNVAKWKQQRTHKLSQSQNRKVLISNAQVQFAPDNAEVKVSFTQDYQSATYKDKSSKTLVLVKESGQWLIKKETSTALTVK